MSDSEVPTDAGGRELDDELGQRPLTDSERLLRRLRELVHAARPVPLSTSAMINRDELLVIIDQALASLPREMRESRWLLKERDEFLSQARAEGDEIINQSRARAERMVQRSELVRAAEARARHIVEQAEAEARRLRLEVEDYCDQKLGSFEIVLERTLKLVGAGRERLQLRANERGDDGGRGDANGPGDLQGVRDAVGDMFDQDQT